MIASTFVLGMRPQNDNQDRIADASKAANTVQLRRLTCSIQSQCNASCKLCSGQDPEQLCTLDLATGAATEGPATLAGPQTAEEFAKLLNPDGSSLLLQTSLAAFSVVELPSLKVSQAASHSL